jgi:hypothetical protein
MREIMRLLPEELQMEPEDALKLEIETSIQLAKEEGNPELAMMFEEMIRTNYKKFKKKGRQTISEKETSGLYEEFQARLDNLLEDLRKKKRCSKSQTSMPASSSPTRGSSQSPKLKNG